VEQHLASTMDLEVLFEKPFRHSGLEGWTAQQHFFSLFDENKKEKKEEG
jgi:hypothetical protein